MRCLSILALVLCAVAPAAPAAAQRQVDIERLEPAFDRHGFVGIQGTRTPGPLQVDAALWTSWSHGLLQLEGVPVSVVSHRLQSNMMAQLGLGGRFVLGVDMPMTLYQSGDPHGLDDGGSLTAFAAGDPRLVFRGRILGEDATDQAPERAEGFGLAALAAVSAPIGADGGYVAEASSVADLRLLADFHVLGLGVGAMLGWRHRFRHERIGTVLFRDELRFGLALEVPLPMGDGWSSLLEVRGWTDARAPFGDSARTGVVGDLGARWRSRDWTVTATLGTGLTSAVGTPRVRAMVGVMWSPRVHDSDGDGIPDHLDQCPHEPEDFDGYQDEDGCMDPDNDGDGIPDVDDACPDEPEDFDGYQDADGCPDGGGPGGVPRRGGSVRGGGTGPAASEASTRPSQVDGSGARGSEAADDERAPHGPGESDAPDDPPGGPDDSEGDVDGGSTDGSEAPPPQGEGGSGLSPPSPAAR